MLAPVLIKDDVPVVLPFRKYMSDDFLRAYMIGVSIEISSGWIFTNSFIDVSVAKGVHVHENDVDLVVLSRDYVYARESS